MSNAKRYRAFFRRFRLATQSGGAGVFGRRLLGGDHQEVRKRHGRIEFIVRAEERPGLIEPARSHPRSNGHWVPPSRPGTVTAPGPPTRSIRSAGATAEQPEKLAGTPERTAVGSASITPRFGRPVVRPRGVGPFLLRVEGESGRVSAGLCAQGPQSSLGGRVGVRLCEKLINCVARSGGAGTMVIPNNAAAA